MPFVISFLLEWPLNKRLRDTDSTYVYFIQRRSLIAARSGNNKKFTEYGRAAGTGNFAVATITRNLIRFSICLVDTPDALYRKAKVYDRPSCNFGYFSYLMSGEMMATLWKPQHHWLNHKQHLWFRLIFGNLL